MARSLASCRSRQIRIATFAFALVTILVAGVAIVEFGIGRSSFTSPSIVLIVLDTVRADHTSLDGEFARDTTPFLRERGAEGLICTHARAAANWTLPSHASLFTGLAPSEHGCHFEHRYLAEEAVTIAEILAGKGYATAGFSSNVNVSRYFNLDQGFDHFYETWNDDRVRAGEPVSDVLCERVIEWIDRHPTGRPFFVFINLMDAHLPYDAAAGYERYFGRDGLELDRGLLAAPDLLDQVLAGEVSLEADFLAALAERYDNTIRGLDARLLALERSLERRGQTQNTTFIVTSDHGENLGDHGLVDHQGSLHESVLRVPLVLWGAGVPAGRSYDQPVILTDLFRWIQTLSEHALRPAAAPPARALLAERMQPIDVLERLAAHRPQVDRTALARREQAVVVPGLPFKIVRREGLSDAVFELASADGEAADVAGSRPEVLAEMQRALEARLRTRRVLRERLQPDPEEVGPSDAELEELRRLGYVSGRRPAVVSVHAQEHLARGNRLYQAGDLSGAAADYEAAARISPGFPDALFNLALVTDTLEPESAAAAWDRYIEAALRLGGQDEDSIQHAYRRLQELGEESGEREE